MDIIEVHLFLSCQAFKLTEKSTFRALLQYQRPKTSDEDIPSREAIHREVLEKAKKVEQLLKDTFKVNVSCD